MTARLSTAACGGTRFGGGGDLAGVGDGGGHVHACDARFSASVPFRVMQRSVRSGRCRVGRLATEVVCLLSAADQIGAVATLHDAANRRDITLYDAAASHAALA